MILESPEDKDNGILGIHKSITQSINLINQSIFGIFCDHSILQTKKDRAFLHGINKQNKQAHMQPWWCMVRVDTSAVWQLVVGSCWAMWRFDISYFCTVDDLMWAVQKDYGEGVRGAWQCSLAHFCSDSGRNLGQRHTKDLLSFSHSIGRVFLSVMLQLEYQVDMQYDSTLATMPL